MADDALLNQFISQGTAAERAAFTPTPPTPIAGPEVGYYWFETDTGDTYSWNMGGAAWVKIAEATSVNAITALTGDVTAAGPGSVAATIAANAVTTAKILDDNVTLAKIANAAANDKLVGSGNAGVGINYVEISLGSGLTMTGTTLSASGSGGTFTTTGAPASGNLTAFSGATSITNANLSGDVTTTDTLVATIANNAVTTAKILDANVTLAKLANIATDSLIGRDTAGSGVPENILLNATLSMDGAGNLQRAALTGDVTATAGSNATVVANMNVTATVTATGTPPTNAVGYLGAPQISDQDDYTLVLADAGKHYYHVSATPHTLTIPANASVAFPIGTVIAGVNENGAGALTIAITTDTLRWSSSTGSRTVAANGSFSLLKVTATLWRLTGEGIT